MPAPLLYRNLTKSLVIVSQHIKECLSSAQHRECLQPEYPTSENAHYRLQCYRSLVSMQSINLSGKVWICQDILSWCLRILIGSTAHACTTHDALHCKNLENCYNCKLLDHCCFHKGHGTLKFHLQLTRSSGSNILVQGVPT